MFNIVCSHFRRPFRRRRPYVFACNVDAIILPRLCGGCRTYPSSVSYYCHCVICRLQAVSPLQCSRQGIFAPPTLPGKWVCTRIVLTRGRTDHFSLAWFARGRQLLHDTACDRSVNPIYNLNSNSSRELWSMTFTAGHDLYVVTLNHHAKYLGQRSFGWNVRTRKVTYRQTQTNKTHTHTHAQPTDR